MAAADRPPSPRPETSAEPEPAFRTQDEWRKVELTRLAGGNDGSWVDKGTARGETPPLVNRGAEGSTHWAHWGRGGPPAPSVFGADMAAVIIAVGILVLIVVALVAYRPNDQPPVPKGNPQAIVWVEKETGLYFCPETKLYGKGKGQYMSQRAAQQQAFRPALHAECE